MNVAITILLTAVIFLVLLVMVLPMLLYLATMLYHFFKPDAPRKKTSNTYSLRDLKEVRSNKPI
ncbi:MAG: hypothetical protein ABH879_00400 [archaeon]